MLENYVDVKIQNAQNLLYGKAQVPLRGSEWIRTSLGWMRVETNSQYAQYECNSSNNTLIAHKQILVQATLHRQFAPILGM